MKSRLNMMLIYKKDITNSLSCLKKYTGDTMKIVPIVYIIYSVVD